MPIAGVRVLNVRAGVATGSITLQKPYLGIEIMRASFRGHFFSSHRHDTYGIGVTTNGVQTFNYRGQRRDSLAGHAFVLHPDEPHDGRAGEGEGFAYRIAYVDPVLLRDAAALTDLPFLPVPVSNDLGLIRATQRLCAMTEGQPDDVEATCALSDLATSIALLCEVPVAGAVRHDAAAIKVVTDRLRAMLHAPVRMAELERISGLSRWALARQFRLASGVSLSRYRLMRRLDLARRLIRKGSPLACVSAACGFADQAHLTRHFKAAHGITPARWRALLQTD